MSAGIIALALTGVGTFLIIVGVWVSLADRKRSLEKRGVQTEGNAGPDLEGLAKLADALRHYPPGMQLIFLGIVLMLAGGATGGVASL
jgi:hypothetical protein